MRRWLLHFMMRSAGAAGNSFASIGGFCAGSREIVDHQRLRCDAIEDMRLSRPYLPMLQCLPALLQ